MSGEGAEDMRYLTMVIIDKPWKNKEVVPSAYLCIRTIPRRAFSFLIESTLRDTGQERMLQQLHCVPLIRLRVLKHIDIPALENGRDPLRTLRSLGSTQYLVWMTDPAYRQSENAPWKQTITTKASIYMDGTANMQDIDKMMKERREKLQADGKSSVKDDMQRLRVLGISAYMRTVTECGGNIGSFFIGKQLLQLAYHPADRMFVPIGISNVEPGSIAEAVYYMSDPTVDDDQTRSYRL
jgi:hypothetical protein